MADNLQEHASQEPEPVASSQSFRVSSAKFHNAKSLRVISGNIRSTQSLRVVSAKLHSEATWVGKVWNRLQVELHGRFSTERIRAMADYHTQTTWWRAVLACFATPLPALFTVTALDIAPVKPPTDGSNANYVYWIRTYIAVVLMIGSMIQHFRSCLPGLPMRNAYHWQLAIGSAVVGTGFTYGLSLWLGFPVPFNLIVQSFPAIPVLLIFMRAIWTRPLKENPALLTALHSQLFAFAGQCVMTYAHALYFFAFTSMTRSQQSIFIFGLPVLKICLKNYISRMLRRLEDVKPAFIVFNIDVFSALYVANCLQSSQSWINTMLIMLVDIVQIGVSITDIRAINREIQSLTPANEQSTSLFDLYEMAAASPKSQKYPKSAAPTVHVAPRGPTADLFSPKSNKVVDIPKTSNKHQPEDCTRLARAIARVLFIAEFLVLIEFAEVMIPLLYSTYLGAMLNLPNRAYYPHLASRSDQQLKKSIASILANASLEFGSFLIVTWLLRRELRLSTAHVVGFVAESQAKIIQACLMAWLLYVIHQSIVHAGVDFTLRFAWLHSSKQV